MKSTYIDLLGESVRSSVWLLIDPDGDDSENLFKLAQTAQGIGVGCILVGGSLIMNADFDNFVGELRASINIPIILFPGNSGQVSAHADAILFMSLLSGRNPQYLIGEQVKSAPAIKKMGIETIPTGYLLIESGSTTAVQFISDTQPIPRHKPALAVAHAQAAELFGMKLIYLEAGSGADKPVPLETVAAVSRHVNIPVITGGGIRNPDDAVSAIKAGARAIVVGTVVEDQGVEVLKSIVEAVKEVNA